MEQPSRKLIVSSACPAFRTQILRQPGCRGGFLRFLQIFTGQSLANGSRVSFLP